VCTGVEIALLAASAAGTATAVRGQRQASKAAEGQRNSMMQAEAERKAAEDKAAQTAQAAVADRRRRLRSQSLLTSGATGSVGGSALSSGKPTLGA